MHFAIAYLVANHMLLERKGTVMHDVLDEQIEAYQALLPDIKNRHGSVWALIADRKLVTTFTEFSAAARYANEHFGTKEVLIRHTDEQPETVPFVHIEG